MVPAEPAQPVAPSREAVAREPYRLPEWRLTGYSDYIDDPDGLERFRNNVLTTPGHDMAVVNHNSLGRLIDTIERLRRERDAALTPDAAKSDAVEALVDRGIAGLLDTKKHGGLTDYGVGALDYMQSLKAEIAALATPTAPSDQA